ncbi:hypothetical protein PHBOTO_001846, partial [Pseudozyma hubeiensis]
DGAFIVLLFFLISFPSRAIPLDSARSAPSFPLLCKSRFECRTLRLPSRYHIPNFVRVSGYSHLRIRALSTLRARVLFFFLFPGRHFGNTLDPRGVEHTLSAHRNSIISADGVIALVVPSPSTDPHIGVTRYRIDP